MMIRKMITMMIAKVIRVMIVIMVYTDDNE